MKKGKTGQAERKGRVIAYLRVSTDQQDVKSQRHEILEYANKQGMTVSEWIEIEISSRKTQKARRVEELMGKLNTGDILIVSEMSRIGRSTAEVISLINELIKRKIRFVAVKQNLDIKGEHDMQSKIVVTLFSLFAELERDIISLRTKSALASKRAQGVVLGRPKGSLGVSKLSGRETEIKELLDKGASKTFVARVVGCSRSNLIDFLVSRGMGEYLKKFKGTKTK